MLIKLLVSGEPFHFLESTLNAQMPGWRSKFERRVLHGHGQHKSKRGGSSTYEYWSDKSPAVFAYIADALRGYPIELPDDNPRLLAMIKCDAAFFRVPSLLSFLGMSSSKDLGHRSTSDLTSSFRSSSSSSVKSSNSSTSFNSTTSDDSSMDSLTLSPDSDSDPDSDSETLDSPDASRGAATPGPDAAQIAFCLDLLRNGAALVPQLPAVPDAMRGPLTAFAQRLRSGELDPSLRSIIGDLLPSGVDPDCADADSHPYRMLLGELARCWVGGGAVAASHVPAGPTTQSRVPAATSYPSGNSPIGGSSGGGSGTQNSSSVSAASDHSSSMTEDWGESGTGSVDVPVFSSSFSSSDPSELSLPSLCPCPLPYPLPSLFSLPPDCWASSAEDEEDDSSEPPSMPPASRQLQSTISNKNSSDSSSSQEATNKESADAMSLQQEGQSDNSDGDSFWDLASFDNTSATAPPPSASAGAPISSWSLFCAQQPVSFPQSILSDPAIRHSEWIPPQTPSVPQGQQPGTPRVRRIPPPSVSLLPLSSELNKQ
jgi:hypothetical protein